MKNKYYLLFLIIFISILFLIGAIITAGSPDNSDESQELNITVDDVQGTSDEFELTREKMEWRETTGVTGGKNRIFDNTLLDLVVEHQVQKGETLWDIARRYNIDIDTIIGANDLSNMNWIKSGDILTILPVKGIMYQIGPGENLWDISRKFDVSLESIKSANGITDPDRVQKGDMIILPGAKPEFGYRDRLEQKFVSPVPSGARISSYYGGRWGKMHEGIDYAISYGSEIRAAGEGKVVYSGWSSGYGRTIIIEHRRGLRTLYAHNSKLLVSSGQRVRRGQLIARSGNSGNSTGPHLHFEVQLNGKPVDPQNYLK
ncbi:MAG: peptidoglycan DD-metalloendopeptidase family protein [Halanaerobiales bacterium]